MNQDIQYYDGKVRRILFDGKMPQASKSTNMNQASYNLITTIEKKELEEEFSPSSTGNPEWDKKIAECKAKGLLLSAIDVCLKEGKTQDEISSGIWHWWQGHWMMALVSLGVIVLKTEKEIREDAQDIRIVN